MNGKGVELDKCYVAMVGYDTEHDLHKAKDDMEQMLCILAGMSINQLIKVLAPYRLKTANEIELKQKRERA